MMDNFLLLFTSMSKLWLLHVYKKNVIKTLGFKAKDLFQTLIYYLIDGWN